MDPPRRKRAGAPEDAAARLLEPRPPGRRKAPGVGALESSAIDRLRAELRQRLLADPIGAYRDWHAVQHELGESGDAAACRLLAEELWDLLPRLETGLGPEHGRFFNNLGAFFGTPGPAADLARAEECFERALHSWKDPERRARALHNRGSALASLAADGTGLARAIACFEEALVFRNAERAIARAVTLHHLGIARRRLAEREPENRAAQLESSRAALSEALEIRIGQGLAAGIASSRFQLGVTLAALGRDAEARLVLGAAAEELAAAGKTEEAELARRLSE